nr:hypothetical protein [Chloroflexota bacterium]
MSARQSTAGRVNGIGLLFGLGFGFVLTAARLTDFDVIHEMLRFQDLQPFLVLGSAIAVAAPLLRILRRRGLVTPHGGALSFSAASVQRHHLLG